MIQTLIKVINYFNSIIIISQIIENAVAIFGNYTDIVKRKDTLSKQYIFINSADIESRYYAVVIMFKASFVKI